MSTADYSAQLQREADWQRQLMQDRQMRDNPWLSRAGDVGWELQPDGQYRRMINGITQTMPAGILAGNLQAQRMRGFAVAETSGAEALNCCTSPTSRRN